MPPRYVIKACIDPTVIIAEGKAPSLKHFIEKVKGDLGFADLRDKDLSGVNLSGAHLSEADLSRCNLEGADLTGAYIHSCNFTAAEMSRAVMRNVRGGPGTNFNAANLSHVKLHNANLREADFSFAHMFSIDSSRAFLRDATLSGAICNNSDFSEATLDGALLDHMKLTDANLSRASLVEVLLDHTDLSRTNFTEAQLSAGWQDITPENANLKGAYVDLNNKRRLSLTQEVINFLALDLTVEEREHAWNFIKKDLSILGVLLTIHNAGASPIEVVPWLFHD